MLEAHSLSAWIGPRQLLDSVSLQLAPGELLAVIGPNGAGKSTLLRALSGELQPAAGAVSLNGRRLAHYSRLELARMRAVMPQSDRLTFPFSAAEVVSLGRTPHAAHSSAAHDARVVQETLAAVDALHLAQRDYTTLSGGERQRVQLARTLAQLWDTVPASDARYLLVDEPTSSLDLAHQHSTLRLLRELRSRNIGVMVILHDLNLAARYADRIALIVGGRLAACAESAAVLQPELLSRVFGLQLSVHTASPGTTLLVAAS